MKRNQYEEQMQMLGAPIIGGAFGEDALMPLAKYPLSAMAGRSPGCSEKRYPAVTPSAT